MAKKSSPLEKRKRSQKKALALSQVYRYLEQGPVTLVTTSSQGKPNAMTMSWHMMMDFEPPIFACVISNRNYSFQIIEKTGECAVNIPTAELADKVVKVGNVSGKTVDKFQKFHLEQEPASRVSAPLLSECYVSLECKVVDRTMVEKYNVFVLKVLKAWIRPRKHRARLLHHSGNGVFIIDGDEIKLSSKKK